MPIKTKREDVGKILVQIIRPTVANGKRVLVDAIEEVSASEGHYLVNIGKAVVAQEKKKRGRPKKDAESSE